MFGRRGIDELASIRRKVGSRPTRHANRIRRRILKGIELAARKLPVLRAWEHGVPEKFQAGTL